MPLPRRPLLGSARSGAPRLDEEPVGVLHHCIRRSPRRDPFVCAVVSLWPVIGHFEDRVRVLIVSDFAADEAEGAFAAGLNLSGSRGGHFQSRGGCGGSEEYEDGEGLKSRLVVHFGKVGGPVGL